MAFSILLMALVLAPGLVIAANPQPVQTYYSPLPETQVQAALRVLYTNVGSTRFSSTL